MSGRPSSGRKPDTDAFEHEIRTMLVRRAADVSEGTGATPLPAIAPADFTTTRRPLGPGRRPGKVLVAAAAVLVVAGFGAVYVAQSRSATTEAGAPITDTLPPKLSPTDATAAPPAAIVGLDDVLASIPPGVDPVGGPPIYRGSDRELPEATARDYLARRLPDLPFLLVQVEEMEPLAIYRWSVDESGYQASGSVVVRQEAAGPVVTLATTDGIAVSSLERTADKLAALVLDDDPDHGLLAADVTTLGGAILGDPTTTDGAQRTGPTGFGSAGIAEGSPLSFEVTLAPVPVVVRIQRVGGTMLSITELVVEPTGFPRSCGDTPPVRIDVGSQLGPLEAGPAPQSSVEPLVNQAVWHYPGPVNTIEVRWPADPTRLALLAPDGLLPDQIPGQGPLTGAANGAEPGLSAGYVLEPVGSADRAGAADPCSVAQIAIYGDPAAVEWWQTALQGELSFGLPLTVADLDPALGPAGSDGAQPAPEQLVIGSDRSTQRPQVPDGACDGLPGAPARQGTGDGTVSATAEATLEAFLAATATTTDPPLPTTGYTEVQIDATTISYVVTGDSSPIVVVDLSHTGAGWTVDRWAASPC